MSEFVWSRTFEDIDGCPLMIEFDPEPEDGERIDLFWDGDGVTIQTGTEADQIIDALIEARESVFGKRGEAQP